MCLRAVEVCDKVYSIVVGAEVQSVNGLLYKTSKASTLKVSAIVHIIYTYIYIKYYLLISTDF